MAKAVRLFVAIELPDEARLAITGEQTRIRRRLEGSKQSSIKWVTPDHLHLTLAFLGYVANERLETVVESMRQPLDAESFSLEFGGLGVFPPRGDPRVLWIGVKDGAEEVVALQRLVADRLARLELTLEERAFHPHLTLARWRSGGRSDRERVREQETAQRLVRIDVSDVTLMESRLSPAGSTYIALCHSRLREPAVPPLQSTS